MTDTDRTTREYNSPLRRQRAAETRARVVAAGAELLHGYPIWNWHALTVRAVAEKAGVNERTVYRHFPSERDLRDAVMAKLEEDAGVDLHDLSLDQVPDITARIFDYVSAFPLEPRKPRDPTLTEAGDRQREALVAAVARATDGWSDEERAMAAAILDVLWNVSSYQRLVAEWDLDPAAAGRAVSWVLRILVEAIEDGRRPGGGT